jgi:glycerol-3-phosphate acyltransferase PlsX
VTRMVDATTTPVTLTLDAQGGDHAPEEVVRGAILAASATLKVLLVGRPEALAPHLAGADLTHIEIVPSESVISSEDEPAKAVRSKTDSSIVVGAATVADGRSQGFVSAGSTGAMLAAGLLVIKRASGVRRPAIVTVLPGMDGPLVFLDAGANADCRPEHLLEFGLLGAVFARRALGIERPRVGLLNIGEEATKGNELALGAYPLLADPAHGLHFVGNVEGRDLLFNAADVVVTDGFTGNVALKLLEGTARAILLCARGVGPRRVRRHVSVGSARPRGDLPREFLAGGHRECAALRGGGRAERRSGGGGSGNGTNGGGGSLDRPVNARRELRPRSRRGNARWLCPLGACCYNERRSVPVG